MPFQHIQGRYLKKQNIYQMEFSREFHGDLGSKWAIGETKELMIGAMIPTGGDKKKLAHSHKMEMRVGNEIWMTEMHKGGPR